MVNETLQIQQGGQIVVDFSYYERVNEIRGGSGSGKSKLVADIDGFLKSHLMNKELGIKQNKDLSKIQIINPDRLIYNDFGIYNSGDWILFIDNYDRYYNEKVAEFIGKSKDTFFLISRNYGLRYQSFYGENILDYDGKTYKLINFMCNKKEYFDKYRQLDC